MKEKKSSGFCVLIICLIICIVVIIGLIYYINKIQKEFNEQVSKLQIELSDLRNQNDNFKGIINKATDALGEAKKAETKKEENNTVTETVDTTKEKWTGDITKIDMSKLSKDGAQYESLETLIGSPDYVSFNNPEDGKVYIRIKDAEKNLGWFKDEDKLKNLGYESVDNTGFSNKVELKNVSNIKFVACGAFGQDFWEESPVLFLDKDGTLSYELFKNVVNNEISLKPINGLSNIAALYSCSVGDIIDGERMGGILTTIAVDEYGVAYDISDYVTRFE